MAGLHHFADIELGDLRKVADLGDDRLEFGTGS
jgi:hypothetical protein